MAQRTDRRQMSQPLEALLEALPDDVFEVPIEGERGRYLEVRQMALAFRNRHTAPLRDANRVEEGVRKVLEHLRHLIRCLEEKLAAVVPKPLGIGERLAGADAEEHVVRMRIA